MVALQEKSGAHQKTPLSWHHGYMCQISIHPVFAETFQSGSKGSTE